MKPLTETIESFIDSHGLAAVLDAVGTVCGEKAEHVATNWQDTTLTKEWETAANAVYAVASKVLGLSLARRT